MPKTTKKITTIPATLTRFTATPITEQKKRRVAGYARVSTDHDDQFTSYEAQIDYYTNYIKSRDDWEFVDVYTDAGIAFEIVGWKYVFDLSLNWAHIFMLIGIAGLIWAFIPERKDK